jgi:hypothetical protein
MLPVVRLDPMITVRPIESFSHQDVPSLRVSYFGRSKMETPIQKYQRLGKQYEKVKTLFGVFKCAINTPDFQKLLPSFSVLGGTEDEIRIKSLGKQYVIRLEFSAQDNGNTSLIIPYRVSPTGEEKIIENNKVMINGAGNAKPHKDSQSGYLWEIDENALEILLTLLK